MKIKPEFVTSILSIFAPICLILTMCIIEQEFVEAIWGGLLIGCLIGSVFGIVSLTINKNKSRLVTIFSIIPMCPLAIYILLLIPYLMYRWILVLWTNKINRKIRILQREIFWLFLFRVIDRISKCKRTLQSKFWKKLLTVNFVYSLQLL